MVTLVLGLLLYGLSSQSRSLHAVLLVHTTTYHDRYMAMRNLDWHCTAYSHSYVTSDTLHVEGMHVHGICWLLLLRWY